MKILENPKQCYLLHKSQIKAVIKGFFGGVNYNPGIRLLWKHSGRAKSEVLIEEVLKDPRDKARFKVVDWVKPDPASIAKHLNVLAYVHRGEVNSYFGVAL